MVKKFDVYINVEDVYSFRVEAESEDAVNNLLDEMFNEYGTDFYGFLEDRRVEKSRLDPMTDYQIDIIELIPYNKVDEILQDKFTNRMTHEDLDD